ncbi:hypothetical protein PENVUL_c119G05131 [Penicillium vulpinum]|uniref:Uncharacterized protein n=1 Tax=Penicillium vulpinum TaxID=29845 RepID=A0A1V6R132_9EURO|nr:hypothetical protein PENVUL_c119G05131 [Penicillium vulpinum]
MPMIFRLPRERPLRNWCWCHIDRRWLSLSDIAPYLWVPARRIGVRLASSVSRCASLLVGNLQHWVCFACDAVVSEIFEVTHSSWEGDIRKTVPPRLGYCREYLRLPLPILAMSRLLVVSKLDPEAAT